MADPCQTFQDAITQVDGQIADIENALNNPEIHIVKTLRDALLQHLATLRGERAQLERELEACLDPCKSIEDQIAADQAQINQLTVLVGGLTLQISQLNTQIAGYNVTIAQLQADIQQQQQALQQCKQAHP